MPDNTSRVGKEVERVSITDEPHDNYWQHDPWTGKKLKNPRPILTTVPGGAVVEKDVTYFTVECPECEVPAKYDEDTEPICPDCGIVCAGKDTIMSEQMVRDAKAAGRVDGSGTEGY